MSHSLASAKKGLYKTIGEGRGPITQQHRFGFCVSKSLNLFTLLDEKNCQIFKLTLDIDMNRLVLRK